MRTHAQRPLRLVALASLAALTAGCTKARPAATETRDRCAACHGSSDNPAPPVSVSGASSTSDVAVGAHQAHLRDGALRGAVACDECHVVPATTDAAGHMDSDRATVTFGALASAAGAEPTWSHEQASCGAVYCHGNFPGGNRDVVAWTQVDGSQKRCGTSCHATPPAAPHPTVAASATCAGCHPETMRPDGTLNLESGTHINGQIEAFGGHPDGWTDPTHHGYEANRTIAGCRACHGTDLAGGTSGVSCDQCHAPTWRTDCSFCHGDPTRAVNGAAPPLGTEGETSSSTLAVGAHQQHLTDSAIRTAVACSDCHAVPTDLTHDDGVVDLSWSPLAHAGDAMPTWDRPRGECTNYCHGATLAGGALTAPTWTQVDGTQASCGTCHGAPPPAPHPNDNACAGCHPATVTAGGTIDTGGGKHINGVLDITGGGHPPGWQDKAAHGYAANRSLAACASCHGADLTGGTATVSCDGCHAANWRTDCTFCHGEPTTGQAAPPVDTQGHSATSFISVGAHTSHMSPALSSPLTCDACHNVPTDVLTPGHIDATSATVTFGTLARTGGVTPTWSHTSATCASAYCHGAFSGGASTNQPLWTTVNGTQMTCLSCHGAPPGTGRHSLHSGHGVGCGSCHAGYSSTAVNRSTHVNGVKNLSINYNSSTRTCSPPCHSSATW
jgi:predicted CxxxxCH...CXXCH cytochrome family protein